MTHTPTPWAAEVELTETGQSVKVVSKSNGVICLAKNANGKKLQNSAFIVRAANAHDALVERLIECQEFIIGYHAAEENDMRRRILGEIIVKNSAALKLARGE